MKSERMNDEDKNTVYVLYTECIKQGKTKAEACRELAETTGKTRSSISSLIWRIGNPDKEKENQRRKKEKKRVPVSSSAFDPEQFIKHYQGLLEENRTLKDELATLQKEFDEFHQSLNTILHRTGPNVKTEKDQDTHNFYVVSVETERGGEQQK